MWREKSRASRGKKHSRQSVRQAGERARALEGIERNASASQQHRQEDSSGRENPGKGERKQSKYESRAIRRRERERESKDLGCDRLCMHSARSRARQSCRLSRLYRVRGRLQPFFLVFLFFSTTPRKSRLSSAERADERRRGRERDRQRE